MIHRYTLPQMGSIWSEENKFAKWLEVELAVCEEYYRRGIIPEEDWKIIKEKAGFDIGRINEIEKITNHDLAAFVSCVQERIGPSGRFIHMGLTSSDVVDTALSLLTKEATELLIKDVDEMISVTTEKAIRYKNLPMIGRTHGIHAEPVTLGLKFLLMREDFKRAKERLIRAKEIISFGKISGAVGTYAHISPEIEKDVCEKLGLKVEPISTQIVQRDRHSEYILMISLVGTTVDRWAQEIRHLQRTEVRELEEPFRKGQKGSSAMPHKRNPIMCERFCGMARLLRGYSISCQENVALWHERDISHSSVERVVFPDATILLDYMLVKFAEVVRDITVYEENIKKNLDLTRGLYYSQRILLTLIDKGLNRDNAYRIVQRIAMEVWRGNKSLKELVFNDKECLQYLSEEEIERIFDISQFLSHIDEIYKRVGLE